MQIEVPKSRTQQRFERIASSMINIMSELTESQHIELYEIALKMYSGRYEAQDALYEESKARVYNK